MARSTGIPVIQLGIFGWGSPAFDRDFRTIRRTDLGRGAWVDYAPGWFQGHESLFAMLAGHVRWRAERREMYDRIVEVPRLYAELPEDGPVLPIIDQARTCLSLRYGEQFARISLGFYRRGNDSVAWHGDYVAREMAEALVATISLGAPRRFLLRTRGGGSSSALNARLG